MVSFYSSQICAAEKPCTTVAPLVSTFQPSRSTHAATVAATQVKLERAVVEVKAESGQVFVIWANNASEFVNGELGDEVAFSGKTKHVFMVRLYVWHLYV
jgi:hypothetical protein